MKFGIALPEQATDVAEFARAAEQVGVESVWLPEHLVWPAEVGSTYPYTEDGRPPVAERYPTHDPWVLLGSAASVTLSLKLGTSVYVLPLRDPHVTARAVGTLDLVSRGRTLLGIGVGWLEEEFRVVGQDFRSRGARTDEIIQILRGLWSDGDYGHNGTYYSFPGVGFEPKPPQGDRLPILVGGESRRALRRATELGDGWIGLLHNPDSAGERVKLLHELRSRSERAHLPFTVTVGIPGRSDVDDIRRYEAAGVERVSLRPWGRTETPCRGLERMETLIDRINR